MIADRDSTTVATVMAWQQRIPEMTPEMWASELRLFLKRYEDVTPKTQHVEAANARIEAWTGGNPEAAKAMTAAALGAAKEFVDQLSEERAARIAAERKEAESRVAAEKRIAELETKVRDLEDSIWRRVRFWFSIGLYSLAAVCLLIAAASVKSALSTGLNVLASLKAAGVWVGFAASLFSLSRVLAAWWFWWACGGVVALIFAYAGYLAWKTHKGAQATRTLAAVVQPLDKMYDDASGAVKEQMDADIFAKLSESMKNVPGAKQFIHQLRAAMGGASEPEK